jgi:hypothetical protein
MLRALLDRLTYANVVATVALFLAVGTGGAYAVSKIDGSDIRKHSLTGNRRQGGEGVEPETGPPRAERRPPWWPARLPLPRQLPAGFRSDDPDRRCLRRGPATGAEVLRQRGF